MSLPYQFANVSTLATPQLDANFAALGALTPIPCAFAGSNSLTLTPLSNTPTLTAYANYMQFTGICANTNTDTAVAAVGGLGAVPIFKDGVNGPEPLTGGEMVSSTSVLLMYDSSLNSNNGGFHLLNQLPLGAAGGSVFGPADFVGGVTFGTESTQATVTSLVAITQSISWPALNPNFSSVAVVPFAGVSIGDMVQIGPMVSVPVGVFFWGWVSSIGTVSMIASNNTAATITPTAGDYRIAAWRIVP